MDKKTKVRKLDLVDITPKDDEDVVWFKKGNTRMLTGERFLKANNKRK